MRKILLSLIVIAMCNLSATAQSKTSVTIFGDSYSTYEGWLMPDSMETWYYKAETSNKRTDVRKVSDTWWWQLIKKKDWKLERNNSWSGATVCYTGYDDRDYTYKSFLTRVDNLGSPDVILLFCATNDSWCGAPIGEYKYEDWRRADLYTFRPAFACLLSRLQERYPTAVLYVISNDGLRKEVTESMAAISSHYGVPMIQLHDIDKISGHPSVKGMRQIAEQVAAAIR